MIEIKFDKAKVKRGNAYKISYKANRPNAKRHLISSFQSEDINQAIHAFEVVAKELSEDPKNKSKTFELYTGNWKLVKEYKPMED